MTDDASWVPEKRIFMILGCLVLLLFAYSLYTVLPDVVEPGPVRFAPLMIDITPGAALLIRCCVATASLVLLYLWLHKQEQAKRSRDDLRIRLSTLATITAELSLLALMVSPCSGLVANACFWASALIIMAAFQPVVSERRKRAIGEGFDFNIYILRTGLAGVVCMVLIAVVIVYPFFVKDASPWPIRATALPLIGVIMARCLTFWRLREDQSEKSANEKVGWLGMYSALTFMSSTAHVGADWLCRNLATSAQMSGEGLNRSESMPSGLDVGVLRSELTFFLMTVIAMGLLGYFTIFPVGSLPESQPGHNENGAGAEDPIQSGVDGTPKPDAAGSL